MARSPQRKISRQRKDPTQGLPMLNVDAAGIDVGSREHWVAVPADRDPRSVRKFATFTADVRQMIEWLKACRITTVVMEATGVYWVALFEELERAGLEVRVVNARYAKNVPGRKSDVLDCQWLQRLHSYGLLPNSFRPAAEIRVLRSYLRQRENLQSASLQCVQHMQKALTEMNVRLVEVLSDLMGQSGRRVLEAILKGERDPQVLIRLIDRRVKATREQLGKSLQGDWREELLFILEQQYRLYTFYEQALADCDRRIQAQLQAMEAARPPVAAAPAPAASSSSQRPACEAAELRESLRRVAGVDLTAINGIDVRTSEIVLSEVGTDMTRWPTEKHFASWLGLCPNHQISGGKVLKRHTRPVVNRASTALRRSAYSLLRSRSATGAKYRRLRARLGAPKAITAVAHHQARLIYRMIRFGHEYVDKGIEQYEAKYRAQQLYWLRKRAEELGMQLTEKEPVAKVVS